MTLNLARPPGAPWLDAAGYWAGLDRATAELDPPFGVLSLEALAWNAHSLLDRAAGTSIRLATKSIRVRAVIDAVLALPGFSGVLAYTLPEALWLAKEITNVVVGYPTTHRAAIRALARSPLLAGRVTLMVDAVEQLDLIDAVIPPTERESIRLCLELDASWNAPLVGHFGAWRSPVHTPAAARALAEVVQARPGFSLVGLMAYESQIAGLVDDAPGRAVFSALVRRAKLASIPELAERRALAVAAVREVADLEFVNGGGTGSIESTAAEAAVTEIAAGSGLVGPHLFDHYRGFRPAPAVGFALGIVRKPRDDIAGAIGGGWIASGVTGADRSPIPVWPPGLRLMPREGAGEVQTPFTGPGARGLGIGDRVFLRHAKAGELSEHLSEIAVVSGGRIDALVPTYRGEGRAFL
ncbi:amino acid deaminase/aldolase [Marisediminicola antarctica]|uniref:Alanine racemase n=1 Tax=Marisediminicola antarctica TaxID=674079 RepID=A0A7L5AIX0_9MICO|nr:amino acid deaminase/aldolase [Marisediminicola antarctica]QHO69344.1 alanine racemase [Marisediminicola antarctica]